MHDAFAENASGSQRDTAAPQFKLVPVEPTRAMIEAAFDAQPEAGTKSLVDAWAAMLAAAPPPTQPEGHEAWMLEAERLLTTFEYAVIGATTPYGSIDTASKARAALLAHLRTKIDAARGAALKGE
jgi:hypothetical protein